MKLSILIPTLRERFDYLERLQKKLNRQIEEYPHQIEVLYNDAGRHMPTGEKRNSLLMSAKGDYVVFIDDDDMIADCYIDEVMKAIKKAPDVITFEGWMTTNGGSRVDFVIQLGEAYEERDGKYYRYPNHIVPMRREVIQGFRFPEVWMGEDYEWCTAIKNAGVLKTGVHIPKKLYHYDFKTHKTYGHG